MASRGEFRVRRGSFKKLCITRVTHLTTNCDSSNVAANNIDRPNVAIQNTTSQPPTHKGDMSQNSTAIGNIPHPAATQLTASDSTGAHPPTNAAHRIFSCTTNRADATQIPLIDHSAHSTTTAFPETNGGHNTQLGSSQCSPLIDVEPDNTSFIWKPKGRGKGKGNLLDYTILRAGKVKLVFDVSLGRPNSEEDNKFLIGECGRVARTYTPFKLRSFTTIEPEDYKSLIIRLQMKFEWDQTCPVGQVCIYQAFARAYNNWKALLAAKIKNHDNPHDALKDRDTGIEETDWQWWVEYVHSPEYQVVSKRNAANRAKQPYVHRAGSRPFVFHQVSCSQAAGRAIGFLELFKRTHYSETNNWINEVAEKQWEEMKTIVEESQSNPDGPISEFEAGQIVLGKKSGYVRGMGRSIIPPPKSSPLYIAQALTIKTLQNELGDMQEKIKAQDERMAKMMNMIEILQRGSNIHSPEVGQSRDDSHSPVHEDVDDLEQY